MQSDVPPQGPLNEPFFLPKASSFRWKKVYYFWDDVQKGRTVHFFIPNVLILIKPLLLIVDKFPKLLVREAKLERLTTCASSWMSCGLMSRATAWAMMLRSGTPLPREAPARLPVKSQRFVWAVETRRTTRRSSASSIRRTKTEMNSFEAESTKRKAVSLCLNPDSSCPPPTAYLQKR